MVKLGSEGDGWDGIFVGLLLLTHKRLRFQHLGYDDLPERERLREVILSLVQESDAIMMQLLGALVFIDRW